MPFLITLVFVARTATATPRTLLLDLNHGEGGRAARTLAQCQWLDRDLTEDLKPDFTNVGMGSVIRFGAKLSAKFLCEDGRAAYQPVERVPIYRDKATLIDRFARIQRETGKNKLFFETDERLRDLRGGNQILEAGPGAMFVVGDDPGLTRMLFAAPVAELHQLEKFEVDGELVWRPRAETLVIPMDTLVKSARVLFPTHIPTLSRLNSEARRRGKAAGACEGMGEDGA